MKTQNMMTGATLAVLLVFGLIAPAYSQTILIDFGNPPSWRGVTVTNPDVNGHYWNGVSSYFFSPDLRDIDGNTTTVDFGFSVPGGTDSYNGPAGVTSNPPTPTEIAATDIDAVALGNLGVVGAVIDFYDSSSFEIQGLDPTKTYNLTFFGSHKYSDDDTTVYSVYTNGTYSAVVDSVSLNVQAPGGPSPNHNRDTVVTMYDVDPQASNILYVRFFGSNGHLGYLNCMQIEEAPGIKARSPQPGDGATLVPLTTNLTWTKPNDYSPVKYALGFRVSNSPDPNYIVVNPVVDLNLDGDPTTTEATVPMVLDYNTKYDWKVTTFEPNSPNPIPHEGPIWSFTTAPELNVNAGPNIMTWLDGGGAVVDLNGIASCQCTFNSLWSVVSKPEGSTVFIASPASAATWASFDTITTTDTSDTPYILKLTAQDNSVPPIVNEDTIEIRVYADACLAAKDLAGYTRLPHDSNDDCKVNLADFVQFAADWLEDLSLTENFEY